MKIFKYFILNLPFLFLVKRKSCCIYLYISILKERDLKDLVFSILWTNQKLADGQLCLTLNMVQILSQPQSILLGFYIVMLIFIIHYCHYSQHVNLVLLVICSNVPGFCFFFFFPKKLFVLPSLNILKQAVTAQKRDFQL